MDYPFTLPGYPDLNLALRPNGFFSSTKILHDGVPLKRVKGSYPLALGDGSTLELKIKVGLDIFSPKVVFAGQTIAVLPPISPAWLVWAYLPSLLCSSVGRSEGLSGLVAWWVLCPCCAALPCPRGPKSSSPSRLLSCAPPSSPFPQKDFLFAKSLGAS